jgi:hypothetical protein
LARAVVATLAAVVLIVPAVASVPGRYNGIDESRDPGARRWLETLGAALPPDSVVVSWWSFSTPMWYGQYVEGWRPDVTIIDDRTILDQGLGDAKQVVANYLGERPVFLIRLPADYAQFEDIYSLESLPGVVGQPVLEVTARDAGAARLSAADPNL